MFVTTTMDGNEQIYPFAFRFGDEEGSFMGLVFNRISYCDWIPSRLDD